MRKSTLICFLAFLMDMANGMVGLCVPLLATALGATYDDLGTIGAAGAAAYAASCLVSGRLSDLYGHRKTAASAVACIILLILLYTRANTIYHVVAVATCVGIALSGYWPTMQSWVSQGVSPHRLARILGGFNISWGIGVMVGPAVGGYFYADGSMRPFLIAAGVQGGILILILLTRIHPETAEAPSAPTQATKGDRRYLKTAWIANFGTIFASGILRVLFPRYATDLGIEADRLGLLLSLIGCSQVVSFLVVSRVTTWHYRFLPLALAQLVGAGGLVLLAVGNTPSTFAVSMLIQGALVGVTFSQSLFYSLDTRHQTGDVGSAVAPTSRGRRAGFHEAIVGTGFLFGPFIGGFSAQHLGPRSPYVLAAAVILTCVTLQTHVLRSRQD